MKALWFITNPGSGSTTQAKCDALEAVFETQGLRLAGRTFFPQDKLPGAADLDAHGVDTLVECGTGKVLSGLVKRIDRDMTGLALNTPADIEAFLKTV